MILDFSSSNWIFLVNRTLTSKKYIVKFQTFAFLNLLNQFWPFSGIPTSFSRSYYFLDFFRIYFFIYIYIFVFSHFFGNPKMSNNTNDSIKKIVFLFILGIYLTYKFIIFSYIKRNKKIIFFYIRNIFYV